MKLKTQVIVSIVAVVLAQGSCLGNFMEALHENQAEASQEEEVQILGEAEASESAATEEYGDSVVGGAGPGGNPVAGSGGDPIAANQGSHTYTGVNTDLTCRCLPPEYLERTYEFSDDSVTEGGRVYTKVGENRYVYYFEWYALESQEGSDVQEKIPTDNYVELEFTDYGFFQRNYSDVVPGEGDPCCYYEFFLADD